MAKAPLAEAASKTEQPSVVESGAADAARQLFERALAGDRVALARGISWIENDSPGSRSLLDLAFRRAGNGVRVGITGPPGAGKSTLVARLARQWREAGETVAIVAVDPTSPFSGGALLGDRVRMSELAGDPGLFIRSMATRGSLGGLAVATSEACDLLEGVGFQRILVETVGVGQSELEVAEAADTVVVVLVPESGDGVQAMKAGLMEIGDLFVLNKADREGASRAAQDVRSVLALRAPVDEWRPPVLLTTARSGEGVAEVVEHVGRHLAHLGERDLLRQRRRRRLRGRVADLLRGRVESRLHDPALASRWDELLADLEQRRRTPHDAAETLWRELWRHEGGKSG